MEEKIAELKELQSRHVIEAEGLKITINGSFGKLGSVWSILFAPDLLIQTTITGQLALLMLIHRLERKGIPVVSGNTDGIIIK
jgi:DNA polymerase elongation subunit (family B)